MPRLAGEDGVPQFAEEIAVVLPGAEQLAEGAAGGLLGRVAGESGERGVDPDDASGAVGRRSEHLGDVPRERHGLDARRPQHGQRRVAEAQEFLGALALAHVER